MSEYFEKEFEALRALEEANLVVIEHGAVQVTAAGWYLVRAIAMVFDLPLQVANERHGFSRVV